MTDLRKLATESAHPASAELDKLSALEIAGLINAEDAKVPAAVARVIPEIAMAIDAVAAALGDGGRLIYVGAGTSGRIAALDASECPPTFNTDPKLVQFVMAGGTKALHSATEASEDDPKLGRKDMAAKKPTRKDVVVGIAASGRTPYTIAALQHASSKGAKTVAIVCNTGSPLAGAADIAIEIETGPEVLAGSTRMKAGTAQKLVCNMITTGAMARLGLVYGNLMVNVHLKNEKLLERGVRILQEAAGVSCEAAVKALKKAKHRVPIALIMLKTGLSAVQAEKRLRAANRNVRKAIEGSLPDGSR